MTLLGGIVRDISPSIISFRSSAIVMTKNQDDMIDLSAEVPRAILRRRLKDFRRMHI